LGSPAIGRDTISETVQRNGSPQEEKGTVADVLGLGPRGAEIVAESAGGLPCLEDSVRGARFSSENGGDSSLSKGGTEKGRFLLKVFLRG